MHFIFFQPTTSCNLKSTKTKSLKNKDGATGKNRKFLRIFQTTLVVCQDKNDGCRASTLLRLYGIVDLYTTVKIKLTDY
jgi:hypothetical protein